MEGAKRRVVRFCCSNGRNIYVHRGTRLLLPPQPTDALGAGQGALPRTFAHNLAACNHRSRLLSSFVDLNLVRRNLRRYLCDSSGEARWVGSRDVSSPLDNFSLDQYVNAFAERLHRRITL